METKKLSTARNQNLHLLEWSIPNPKGWILLVHGLGEHIGRYQHVAHFFNQNQFSVLGYDHIGHGKSDGERGVVLKYNDLLDDLQQVLEICQQRAVNLPVFIYAHSMGGNIALNFLLKRKPSIAGMITTGAAIKLAFEPNPFVVALGKLTRSIYPSFSQKNQLVVQHISRNSEVIADYQKDDLVHDKIGAELGISLLETGKWLMNYHGESPCPLLLMHGSDDKLTHPDGSKILSTHLTGDVTLKIWSTLYHEIHNEPEQLEVLNFAMGWVNRRV